MAPDDRNGLSINEAEFSKLSIKSQNLILFQNQRETLSLIKSYKTYQKVQYVIITGLLFAVGLLLQMHLFPK